MIQNAIIKKELGDGVAQVSLLRQMECGLSCTSCEGCPQKPTEEILALASNAIGAKPGDHVEVESTTGNSIGIAVLVFLLPCIFLLAGYLIGQGIGLSEAGSFGAGILGLLVGCLPSYLLNRAITRRKGPEFRVLGYHA